MWILIVFFSPGFEFNESYLDVEVVENVVVPTTESIQITSQTMPPDRFLFL